MAFWTRKGTSTPNHAGSSASFNPGDPNGVVMDPGTPPVEARSLPMVAPSPWNGWPAEWSTPTWNMDPRFNQLVDVAWMCLDLNASVLSTMPVYRCRNGVIIPSTTWMANPDPTTYTSWHEFAKQLFWDYQLGEAFVLPMAMTAEGWPASFRVIAPWLVNVEMRGGRRVYNIGSMDVTDEILHIRYKSTSDSAHGVGPLESAGARMITAGVLAKYIRDTASTGGMPEFSLETELDISREDAQDMQQQWVAGRLANPGAPPVLWNGIKVVGHPAMSPKEMTALEVAQFTEARIAELLGVPAPLVGLPTGDPMTYSNITSLFDFHDRASLKPKATAVMSSMSYWSLPRGQVAELNRDEYTRPSFDVRAHAWVELTTAGIVDVDEVRVAERLPPRGGSDEPAAVDSEDAAVALTGGLS